MPHTSSFRIAAEAASPESITTDRAELVPTGVMDSGLGPLGRPGMTATSALPDALFPDAGEPLGEGARVGRAVALEHARLVEQKMDRIFLQACLLAAELRQRHNQLMPRIDFEARRSGRAPPGRAGEHLRQTPD